MSGRPYRHDVSWWPVCCKSAACRRFCVVLWVVACRLRRESFNVCLSSVQAADLKYATKGEQMQLLQKVLAASEKDAEEEYGQPCDLTKGGVSDAMVGFVTSGQFQVVVLAMRAWWEVSVSVWSEAHSQEESGV